MKSGEIDLKEIDRRIQTIKRAAEGLTELGGRFPALSRNTARILASVEMLEINVSHLVDSSGGG